MAYDLIKKGAVPDKVTPKKQDKKKSDKNKI